jgi:PBSX family phage terminase large subunit
MSSFYENMCDNVTRNLASEDGVDQTFWRLDAPVLEQDSNGNNVVTVGGMWPTQRLWWDSDKRIKALIGGMGSGKTFQLGKRMISLALENAPSFVATVSPSYAMAMKTIIPTVQSLLARKRAQLGRTFWWRYVANPIPMVTVRYKGRTATIWFLSSDNPMSLRGPNLAAVGIDEPFMQPEVVYKEVVSRVREPTAVRREICLAGTPESLNSWGYDLCVGELGNTEETDVFRIATTENLSLPPSYIEDMKATYSAKALRAYLFGEFVDMTEGQVYHAFDHMDNVVSLPRHSAAQLGCGMDFNVNPMAATVFWHAGSHIHLIDEIELSNAGTEEMVIELKLRYPELVDVYPDASGGARKTATSKTDHSILKSHGYKLHHQPANPAIRDRINTVNGKLRNANGKVTCTIDPKCKKLKKYLATYTGKNTKADKEKSHLLDALGYPICELFPIAGSKVREVRFL